MYSTTVHSQSKSMSIGNTFQGTNQNFSVINDFASYLTKRDNRLARTLAHKKGVQLRDLQARINERFSKILEVEAASQQRQPSQKNTTTRN